MEMSPQRVRSAEFKSVRKGVDADEVRSFLGEVADELERAQNQSTAMEARARAAVARLQEVGEGGAAAAPAPAAVDASVDESETISRTLLLAQRTADTAVAEARAEAEGLRKSANDEAAATRDSTRVMAAQMLDEARTAARQAGDAERIAVEGEVDALKARRDFLESDVEQLEIFLAEQRNRVREAATSLLDVADRVPGGLGDVRAPLLSASDDDDDDDDDDDEVDESIGSATGEPATSALSDEVDGDDTGSDDGDSSDGLLIVTDLAEGADNSSATHLDDDPWSTTRSDDRPDPRDEPTAAMPVVEAARTGDSADDSDGFKFSFDDDDR